MARAEALILNMDGVICAYDMARSKLLSTNRESLVFTGRDSSLNGEEYARVGAFTSNQTGIRLPFNMTLVSISVQTSNQCTWTAEVRKNRSNAAVASLSITSQYGLHDNSLNVNFDAGDEVQVYIRGSGIGRPVIKLVFAQRF